MNPSPTYYDAVRRAEHAVAHAQEVASGELAGAIRRIREDTLAVIIEHAGELASGDANARGLIDWHLRLLVSEAVDAAERLGKMASWNDRRVVSPAAGVARG